MVEMRRHYANYFKGIPHFKETRMKLVSTERKEDIYNILDELRNLVLPAN